ncbi:hypothetical protein EYF80_046061 [Liparis tanakae]|uniref:Shadow of prion protein 2 n=1 Tax=Liparis tanakae TaxID=230148 RepID=A0A4Z2FTP9_9TELE|nr:hypothetical protein EYF80_046061 [Liparis tanakae]
MTGQRRLLPLCVWLLLMAALCSGAEGKRGGLFKGRGKGDEDDDKAPPAQNKGLSKKGLKWAGAGAAAAGMLGGTGTGLGMKIFGKIKHRSGSHHSHKKSSSEQSHRLNHNERSPNQSVWRAFAKSAAAAPTTNVFFTLGHAVFFLIAAWIGDI